MRKPPLKLKALIEPVVAAMGYELVGIEFHGYGKGALLRLYIDKEGGIGVGDCQRVSYQVSGILDVEDPIPSHYTLEVSSPGLDRPLFSDRDFDRFVGRAVRIRMAPSWEGRRRYSGLLRGVRAGQVVIEQDGCEVCLPLQDIDRAHLVPEL
jgi:Uncharacterized protein conserved in bacteria